MFKVFSNNHKNIMKSLNIRDFAEANKALMEELLKMPWQGGFFSKRLWKNTFILSSNLNEFLTQGFIQGKIIAEISIELNNLMQQGFNIIYRIVRT